jgi:transcriptional regulator with XRE-family HTH domain
MNSKCPTCLGTGLVSIKGEIFRAAREICNLSRQELADCVGVSHVTIRNIEKGYTKPQRTTLQCLTEEFNSRGVEFNVSYEWTKNKKKGKDGLESMGE